MLQWQVRRWCRENGDEDHAEIIRQAVKWLGPWGPLLADRAPPTKEHFFNFPLSASLRLLTHCGQPQPWTASSTASSMTACSFLRRPMLRLAAQETVERWEKMSVETHQRHSRHVMARAVFELYASASECFA